MQCFSEGRQTWCGWMVLLLLVFYITVGCSPVPRKYLREADSNVKLTTLVNAPDLHKGKLVILGGVILEEEMREGRLWLHARNRPLDQDYRPQLPPSVDDPEAGWYWVIVGNHQSFPPHQQWADMTVVGRLTGLAPGKEPMLSLVYVRGWGLQSTHDAVWEDILDANYLPSVPAGAMGEMSR
ncbi:MAG: Slp family lipoprotein [Nitrospirota bacterium]